MTDDYPAMIRAARVYDVAVRSPLELAPKLSARLGREVLLKREDLQPVFSFKLRGAYSRIVNLDAAARARGVIAASAGNHAQGVALAARKLGIDAVIVMPVTTPSIKIDAVRAQGARVELSGASFDDCQATALEMAAREQREFIPPYDDPLVIAGQGTVGLEIVEQLSAPADALFVPVGGGGLIAGVAAAVKSASPTTRIIAVEAEDSACLHAAWQAGERVTLGQVGLFADGVAVRCIGAEPFRVLGPLLDEVVTCSVDEICAAIRDIYEDNRSVAEPAGALAVAGLKKYCEQGGSGQRLVAIESGANINFDRLRHVAERAEVGEHREALLAVEIPERPGSFLEFCRELEGRVVTEFNYRLAAGLPAHIFVGVRLSGGEAEKNEIIAHLRAAALPVTDLSGDEMAKDHVRYMVGGRINEPADEMLLRFEFPERPNALLDFLSRIGSRWNISLFHYRNHGSAFGRVLVGLQVPLAARDECREVLDGIGFPWAEETDNPAYRLFLH